MPPHTIFQDMQVEEIDRLIARYLAGESTDEEVTFLEKWKEKSEENLRSFEIIKTITMAGHQKSRMLFAEKSFQNIWSNSGLDRNSPVKRSNQVYAYVLRIAAALTLVALTLFSVNYLVSGRKIQSDSEIVATFIEKNTLSGQKSKIFLPDGSSLWLNAESRIRYESNFNDSTRKVFLEGEAYFTIRKDTLRPFIVIANSAEVTALGTEFNVNAYRSEESIRVALTTGKVRVRRLDFSTINDNSIVLLPGEMATVPASDNHITKSGFDLMEMVAWKDGVICFQDADFNHVIQTLEKWYGVSFQYEGAPAKQWKFTGTFPNYYLDNILLILSFSEDFKYTIIGDTVKLEL